MCDVFDSRGYFRTGDIGRREGDKFFILGRKSTDAIRFSRFRLYAPEIEDALLRHPSILSAIVVGVADDEVGQRVATVIVPQSQPQPAAHLPHVSHGSQEDLHAKESQLDLASLRKWLALKQNLPVYKLPTLLRTIQAGEPLPQTHTGKLSKVKVRDTLFSRLEKEGGRVEVWDLNRIDEGVPTRPWDWDGIQAAAGMAAAY